MRLVAIANGMAVATKEIDGDEIIPEVRAIMWAIPECDRVNVYELRGGFTIHRDEFCLCDTGSYPCECGMAGE